MFSKQKFHSSILTKGGRVFKTSLQRELIKEGKLDAVMSRLPKADLVQAYYWFFHDLSDYPKRCHCGNPITVFAGFHRGYEKSSCSVRCAALDIGKQQRAKQTLFNRYGVEHQMHLESVKTKVSQTTFQRYGVLNSLSSKNCRDGILKKYGVEHISQSSDWLEKTTKTFNEKYGGRGFGGSLGDKGKETLSAYLGIDPNKFSFQELASLYSAKNTAEQLSIENGFELLNFDAEGRTITLKHACENIEVLRLDDRTPRYRCFQCSPLKFSSFETEVFEFVKGLTINSILRNDRKIIAPYELDIVVPEHKLAIECNGDYWHSFSRQETKDERLKHLKKLEAAHVAGFSLMQIAEHEWATKKEILKSILRVRLKKCPVIFARKTELKKITVSEANSFCRVNHLQGAAKASTALGLFLKDELVACVTISKNRFIKNGSLELIRFACKLNTVIVGAFTKLLSGLREVAGGNVLESYLDRRLFSGSSLSKNGWSLIRQSNPGYCWLYKGARISRNRTQKHRLKSILGEDFNPLKSEAQNMFSAGAMRLWDCGQNVYSIKL